MRVCSIVLLSVLLGGAAAARAQDVVAGVKGGVGFAGIQFIEEDDDIDFDRRTGFTGGGFVVWPANARFGLQLEALYSQKGARLRADDARVDLNLDYLDLPVLLRVSTPRNTNGTGFHFFGGPSFGVRVRAKATATFEGQTGTEDVGDDLASHDIGIVAGGGVDVGRFVVDVRQVWGLTNINRNPDEDDTTIRNRVFAVMAGVRF